LHPRAEALIASLTLEAHPEGGYFREIHRSGIRVQPLDGREARCGLTAIYFLLAAGMVSRWHTVDSDEAWHYCEGDPLDLLVADARFEVVTASTLGPWDTGSEPVRVVPAGEWQAARCRGAYTLVACTVGPGFEFVDFRMLADADADTVRRRHPAVAGLI